MSDYDYYRGSSSYEVAVKNRLNALEATGVATTHAIHNMESGIRSDIQANTNAIQEMTLGIRSDIRQSTYAVVASQAMLAQTFQHGFNAINNTLSLGFGMVSNKLDAMSDRICSKLDEIHDIVNNPLLTQSRELFRRALNNYNRGYYEEALEDCKGAVEKNKTDFISWNLLGQIYLFGAGKFSNVIDIDKAEEAFYNATKYIDSDIGHSDEANTLASEIYYHLGLVRLIKSNDFLVENKSDESNNELLEAEKASRTAYQLSEKNLDAGYEQAKELHFLGKDTEALSVLDGLIRAEKNFAIRASNDKNFASLWEQIDALILRLGDERLRETCGKYEPLCISAKKKLEELQQEFSEIHFPTAMQINGFIDFCHDEFEKSGTPDSFQETFHENEERKRRFASFASIGDVSSCISNARYLRDYDTGALRQALGTKIASITAFESSITALKEKKKDYFSLLEVCATLDEKFSEWEHDCFNDETCGFLPDVVSKLHMYAQKVQNCCNAQVPWKEQETQRMVKIEKENRKKAAKRTVPLLLGFLFGAVIGIIVTIIAFKLLTMDEHSTGAVFLFYSIIGGVIGFILDWLSFGEHPIRSTLVGAAIVDVISAVTIMVIALACGSNENRLPIVFMVVSAIEFGIVGLIVADTQN